MSEGWVPPGHVDVRALVRERGVADVRSDLFRGRLAAFKWDALACELKPIEPRSWCSHNAEQWLASGMIGRSADERPPVHHHCARGGRRSPLPADGEYLSPFIGAQIEASRHFRISAEDWPKKEKLEEYFKEKQKLSDGTPITSTEVEHLATFSRPPAAKRGGNKKKG